MLYGLDRNSYEGDLPDGMPIGIFIRDASPDAANNPDEWYPTFREAKAAAIRSIESYIAGLRGVLRDVRGLRRADIKEDRA